MALFETKKITTNDQKSGDDFFTGSDISDHIICGNPGKLERLIKAISPGKCIQYVSDGDWSMHDLVTELLKKFNPADLYITTYALREFSVRQLILAMDRKELSSVRMLLDYRAKVRTPEVFQLASLNINKIGLMAIHAKVTVLHAGENYISIVGSANWTSNPRVEVGTITMSPEAGKFHISWINKLLENAEIFG